ncbi:MAG: hemolysin family protein [Rhodobacteraceae bacterium]|nr:hemolysin family protein [Paracoccaceae bacterium]
MAEATPPSDGRPPISEGAGSRWSFGLRNLFGVFPGKSNTDGSGAVAVSEPAQTAPGISNLRRLRVEDVAVPKSEIVALEVSTPEDEVFSTFRESGFSRLPVYEGTLDMPLGMIHLKDVALRHVFNGNGDSFDLRPMVRPLLYAPPSMPIGVLLQKMQNQRMHMALVIDEYGGTDGLVTIEDLIEQVVGEIEDEHDTDEDALWSEEAPGCYLALARTPLAEFEAMSGVDLSGVDVDEEMDTLGGLIFLLIGRVPARGEVIPHPSGVEFEVIDADPRRIKRLRIRLPKTDGDGR